MRTNVPHIFAIGDIVGQPMLAHKAVHEAPCGGGGGARRSSFFDARADPVRRLYRSGGGLGRHDRRAVQGGGHQVSARRVFPWAASGRAIANGRDEGFTKLIFDDATHRVIGGGIVGTHAGDLIGEVCLAIEMGCDAGRYRQDHPPAPDAGRVDRHGRRGLRGHLHRSASAEEEIGPAP